jgi:hypothetical protein
MSFIIVKGSYIIGNSHVDDRHSNFSYIIQSSDFFANWIRICRLFFLYILIFVLNKSLENTKSLELSERVNNLEFTKREKSL